MMITSIILKLYRLLLMRSIIIFIVQMMPLIQTCCTDLVDNIRQQAAEGGSIVDMKQ